MILIIILAVMLFYFVNVYNDMSFAAFAVLLDIFTAQ